MWVSVQCCQLHLFDLIWYVLPPRCAPSAINRVRLRTFVSPTLLSSTFVAQNSASVGGKIEQAWWIFNTRRCLAGLPQPSGLISTANTVARRLTPNCAWNCSLSHWGEGRSSSSHMVAFNGLLIFSLDRESCCPDQREDGDMILLWWSVQSPEEAFHWPAMYVHIRVEHNCVSWDAGGGY